MLKLSGVYIDTTYVRTWENNIIGGGISTPPRVEVIGRGISTTTDPIKHKKTKKKGIARGEYRRKKKKKKRRRRKE